MIPRIYRVICWHYDEGNPLEQLIGMDGLLWSDELVPVRWGALHAEVLLADVRRGGQMVGTSLEDDAPFVQDVDPVGHRQREGEVLLHQQHRQPVSPDLLEDLPHPRDEQGSETLGGFV